ncbi:MAG TPA: peptidylprolyl isomerase [Candidatus Saccharimonadia bacterium]|nr:peptidylprolyl isomerase [Candidatus Saccharimonadia bacterium]
MRITLLGLALLATFASVPAAAQLVDKPIATRGDASVTFADVDARMARIPEKDRAATIGTPERIESIVSGMLLTRQLANEARKLGLDKDPAILREMELSAESVLARYRLDQIGDAAEVDVTQLAKEVYQADPARFTIPEQRRVRHVLIRTQNRSKEDARKLADEVLADARKPGADFEEIAKGRSEDETTKAHGGLLPEFGPDVMEQSFYDASFALAKPGDISEVVETPYGFHVIQLVGTKPSRLRPYTEVREELERKLEQEQRERVVQNHADTLRNLPIEADPASIASLRNRFDDKKAPADGTPAATEAVLAAEGVEEAGPGAALATEGFEAPDTDAKAAPEATETPERSQ